MERPTNVTAVSTAYVLDIKGECLPHPNGYRWNRLVVHPEDAKSLYLDLSEVFG